MIRSRLLSLILIITVLAVSPVFSAGNAYSTISVEAIEKSLPAEKIAIGLDVDDTVLFSSPGFHYAFNNTDGPGGTNKYGKKPLSSDEFWADLSGYLDKFSIPKEAARRIISMHKNRGDSIYFITARPAVKKEILTDILHHTFNLEGQPKVIFSGRTSKGDFIKKHGIVLYYGDSDTDISESHDVGVRAIRFMRSPLSNNKTKYNPGMYGEAVLENSEN